MWVGEENFRGLCCLSELQSSFDRFEQPFNVDPKHKIETRRILGGSPAFRVPDIRTKIDPHTRSKSASPDVLSKSTRDQKTLKFGKAVHPPRAPQVGTDFPSPIEKLRSLGSRRPRAPNIAGVNNFSKSSPIGGFRDRKPPIFGKPSERISKLSFTQPSPRIMNTGSN
ncbi:hypothetical protein NPIL_490641 [Nephila pilipes]|uniref:Uncharacterized protein n=1 Tax=Nephila pilipes TaxID=299642 RepID=A0A8X6PL28_NEPPI|nr:hypothetical protein NPIL_490641 [Nephila pilipes]